MLSENQESLQRILNKEKVEKQQIDLPVKSKKKEKEKYSENEVPKLHYFLCTALLTKEKYKDLIKLEQTITYFSIKQIMTTNTDVDNTKNNMIKVKNLFCSLLYNYKTLVKTDFIEGTTRNSENILKELDILIKLSNIILDGPINSECYIAYLLKYLKKIPEDLTENDYEKLYNEIENDVNHSIKKIDIEMLLIIMDKIKNVKRYLSYYEDCEKNLIEINLNEKAKEITEKEFIPVEIKFIYNDELKKFEINPIKFKEKDRDNIQKKRDYEKSKKSRLCLTIDEFIKKFPNLIHIQKSFDSLKLRKYIGWPNDFRTKF